MDTSCTINALNVITVRKSCLQQLVLVFTTNSIVNLTSCPSSRRKEIITKVTVTIYSPVLIPLGFGEEKDQHKFNAAHGGAPATPAAAAKPAEPAKPVVVAAKPAEPAKPVTPAAAKPAEPAKPAVTPAAAKPAEAPKPAAAKPAEAKPPKGN